MTSSALSPQPSEHKKPIVIKYGGSLLEDPAHRSAFLKDVAKLARREQVILVHGGGKEITRAMEAAGIQARFVHGRRYTDEKTMELVEKVLSKLNGEIVAELRRQGIKADGVSGRRNHLMEAQPVPELGRVGRPRFINEDILGEVMRSSDLPVFYSVAEDVQQQPLNINADDFALALAIASRAKRLVFLTDTGAILDKKGKPLTILSERDVDRLIQDHIITGGMTVKAQACIEALHEGVGRVDICKGIQSLIDPDEFPIDGTSFVQDASKRN